MKTILRNFLSVLRRFKMATALNVLGLSVAFAAFLIIMMQLDYDRGFDRSHPEADRIYRLEVYNLTGAEWAAIINYPLAEAFIASSPHILAGGLTTGVLSKMFFSVETNGVRNFYEESALGLSPGYTGVFTFDMLEGSDRAADVPGYVLLPASLARKLFGEEPAVGKQLTEGDKAYTVGGVYRDFPPNSSVRNCLYFPITRLRNWGNWNYNVFIRVDSPENVSGLFENFRKTFDVAALHPGFSWKESELSFRFTPLADLHYITGVMYDMSPKSSRQTLFILLGIALVIVFIAGINYMNFSMALTPRRIKSINTQKVLGGSERALRGALVVEAAAISLLSYLPALGLVELARDTPVAPLVNVDISLAAHPLLVGLTAGVAVLTGVLAGLYPARYVTSFPPAMTLKGSFGLSSQGRKLRSALISVQFVASFVLIIGASFMYLQNHFMQHSNLGFDRDELIVTNLSDKIRKSREAFAGQLKRLPDIEQVGCSEFLLSSGDKDVVGWGLNTRYNGKEVNFKLIPVDVSFLEAAGIRPSDGRSFRPEDALTENGAYVFNEKARDVYGLELNGRINGGEIVGFAPDMKFASFRSEVVPMAFQVVDADDAWSSLEYAYVRVRAGSDMRAAIEHVRATLKEFDDAYPFNVRFFDQVLNQTYESERKLGRLISLFSLVAILISTVGVFGLVVFDSEYRRKEISLRKIFGSTTGGILLLFNKAYLRLLIPCFVVAAPLAWYAVGRWLENFAYRTPLYWWVYLAAFALVSLLTIATVTFQNWRAANANPAEGIRD
jgi:putative ABC transport system permease protein